MALSKIHTTYNERKNSDEKNVPFYVLVNHHTKALWPYLQINKALWILSTHKFRNELVQPLYFREKKAKAQENGPSCLMSP